MAALLVLAALLVMGAAALLSLAAATGMLHLRAVPAGPHVPDWHWAVRRVDVLSAVAALAGLAMAAVAALVFPIQLVSVTPTPGLLAALGPVIAGLVHTGALAVGELTWPRPQGTERQAFLVRRPALAPVRSFAARLVPAWLAVGTVVILVAGLAAEPDGRSIGSATTDASGNVIMTSTAGPFPGWPYGLPVLAGMAALALAYVGVRHLIVRRPAVPDVSPDDDLRIRTVSATRLAQGVQLALAVTTFGLLLVGAGAAGHVGYYGAAWCAGAIGVTVLVVALIATGRRVRP